MKNFILMIQFLTRIPINIKVDVDDKSFINGIVYFPLVGLVVGILNVFFYLLSIRFLPVPITAVLVTLFNVCLTGAFHLDGLSDTCDGIYSSRKRERMLEIMKDSRVGTNGAAAIFFDLALRIVLLASLSKADAVKALAVSAILSRTMIVLLSHIAQYARKEGGLGNYYIGKINLKTTIIAILTAVLLSSVIIRWKAVFVVLPVILITFIYNIYIKSKIGGMTGDTLGAAVEFIEVLVFLIILSLSHLAPLS
ncbi:MAG: adenosylcobinamide-GDP ribazoletransferase [Bacillota bacterium]|nr:adenosylcobinamide-GDP ribazoletransferase [Bacillota bacterium]